MIWNILSPIIYKSGSEIEKGVEGFTRSPWTGDDLDQIIAEIRRPGYLPLDIGLLQAGFKFPFLNEEDIPQRIYLIMHKYDTFCAS